MPKVKLAGRLIGPSSPFIVAEIGINHNGDLLLAKKLIRAAREAGADAVKFQSFQAEDLASTKSLKGGHLKVGLKKESLYDFFKRHELSPAAHRRLRAYADKLGIAFFSAPFSVAQADMLETLQPFAYKIASREITNLPLIVHVARKRRPVVLSTGMATLGEVAEAVRAIEEAGNHQIVILHCVSCYPPPADQVNLRAIETLRKAFPYPVGYSDHLPGISASVAAIALGAALIEKHFTLDKNLPGPDHQVSATPAELSQIVQAAKEIPLAMGDGVKRVMPCETDVRRAALRSIAAAREIRKGSVLTEDDLRLVAPASGLAPHDLPLVAGRRVKRDLEPDEPITLQDLS